MALRRAGEPVSLSPLLLKQACAGDPSALRSPLATVLLRSGDRAGAQAAARRTLTLDPSRTDARQLLAAP